MDWYDVLSARLLSIHHTPYKILFSCRRRKRC